MAEPTTHPRPAADDHKEDETDDDTSRRNDRDYHVARLCAGLPTGITDSERARLLARLLGGSRAR